MTTFYSSRSLEPFKLDQRTLTLGNLLETVHSSSESIHPMHQTSISFQNFKMHIPLHQTNTGFKSKGAALLRLGQYLQEIDNPLPKISSISNTKNKFAMNVSKINSSKLKGSKTNSEFNSMRNTRFTKKTQNSFYLSNNNKSNSDLQSKLTADLSAIHKVVTKQNPLDSKVSSPKKSFLNDELPSKRRALDQETIEAYRTIINSKEHGKLQDFALRSLERESSLSSNKKVKSQKKLLSKTKESEEDETIEDDTKLIDDLKEKGLKDFQKKLNLYNFIKANYLVDPDGDKKKFESIRSHMRKLVLPEKLENNSKDTKESLWASFSKQIPPAFIEPKTTNQENIQKIRNERLKKAQEISYTEPNQDPLHNMTSQEIINKNEDLVKINMQRMKTLGDTLPKKKSLSENEQLIFKFVKQGNEMELGYLLAQSHELVKVEDARKETPLHWAVKRGYYNIVSCLCRYGADIDAVDMANRKPIDIAERLKRFEIAELLRRLHVKKEIESRFS